MEADGLVGESTRHLTVSEGVVRSLIIGDSLAMPRPHRGQQLADTWPSLLMRHFPEMDFWQRCRNAAATWNMVEEFNQFSDSIASFQFLVLQAGIVDCCPRPYPFWFEQFIRTYCSADTIRKVNAQYRWALKLRSKPFTSREQIVANFKHILDLTFERNPEAVAIVIAIGTPCNNLVQKAPGIVERQTAYNSALRELCESFPQRRLFFVDPYVGHDVTKVFLDDGHHLTVLGHQLVAEAVSEVITSQLAIAREL